MDIDDWYQRQMIESALRGDPEAGRAALELCAGGLSFRNLSPQLADYLRDRIWAFLDGEPIERAFCVEVERGPGRPKNPFPEWKRRLAAFDSLLERRGYRVEQRNAALDEARRAENTGGSTGFDRREAGKLRAIYTGLKDLDEAALIRLAGERLRVLLGQFPPQP